MRKKETTIKKIKAEKLSELKKSISAAKHTAKEIIEIKKKISEEARIEQMTKDIFIQEKEENPVVINPETFQLPRESTLTIKNAIPKTNIKCDVFGILKVNCVYQVDITHPVIAGYLDKKLMVIVNTTCKVLWTDLIDIGKRAMIKYYEKQRRIKKANAEKSVSKEEVETMSKIIDEKFDALIAKVNEK